MLVAESSFNVNLGNGYGEATIIPWTLKKGSGKAVFLEAISPENVVKATQSLYSQKSYEEEMVKYVLLGKAAAKYITERIGSDFIKTVDLQESLSALAILSLPDNLRKRARFITHTPGPWGHRSFDARFLNEAYGREVMKKAGFDQDEGQIMLTELALKNTDKTFSVSQKAGEIVRGWDRLKDYRDKIGYVTNGVDPQRWVHPEIAKLMLNGDYSNVTVERFSKAHGIAREDLINLVKQYKPGMKIYKETAVVSWARRPAEYKRPYFIESLIDEIGKNENALFVLAGKAHPDNEKERDFMRRFEELSRKYDNVVYIPDYDIEKAKKIVAGSDLFLFTPFSGWEACGTSFMKAGMNGVPTLASRDGATPELIKDGMNGWFFGNDIRECIDLVGDYNRADQINKVEYKEMKEKFLEIIALRKNYPDKYAQVMIDALKSFREKADITNALKDYGIIEGNRKPENFQGLFRGNATPNKVS